MRKATVTYIAPEGDNKVVEMGGVTFFDGKEVEINSEDNPFFFSRATPDAPTKIEANQHFDVVMGEEQPHEKRKPGRPPKVTAPLPTPKPAAPAFIPPPEA